MPSRKLLRAFVALWWTLGAVVLYLSIRTVLHGRAPHTDVHAVLLGTIEAGAALLFLVPRTLRAGAIGLLLTFAAAFLLHAVRHEFAASLLIYAAGVAFIWVHGPVDPRITMRSETTGGH